MQKALFLPKVKSHVYLTYIKFREKMMEEVYFTELYL